MMSGRLRSDFAQTLLSRFSFMHLVVFRFEHDAKQTSNLHFIVNDERRSFHAVASDRKLHWLADRKADGKTRAAFFAILRDDLPAVYFDQLARDGEAESEPARRSSRTTVEFFEHFVLFARRETGAMIGDGKNKRRIVTHHVRFDGPIGFSMSRRVGEQRRERLFDETSVHRNSRKVLARC